MKPIVLCILDGVGIRNETTGNAFFKANKPNFDKLMETYPHSLLEASGELVGLPYGQMGNSEVGHMNIGAGRIVFQPLQLINEKIKTGEFKENKEFKNVIEHVKNNNSKLHLCGLLSDGGIHSHINHLESLLEVIRDNGINEVCLHAFLDGRDTLPNSALKYLEQIEAKLKSLGMGKIATLSGRYYAMDRDNRWDRVELAYKALVDGKGIEKSSYQEAIESSYNSNELDEFVKPVVLDENSKIDDNDGVILFNFRPDRGRELFSAITNSENTEFERTLRKNIKLVTMMPLSNEVIYTPAYNNQNLENTLGEFLANKGYSQLRIAETEKYAHVTYFFDGGVEKDLENAKRILIPSPKVATYDLKPEMSALEITNNLIEELENYDVVIVNYANGDMVGHTGNIEAAVKAIETVDNCLGKLYEKTISLNGTLLVTADHGNCDLMLDNNGNVITSHSLSKVPFIVTTDATLVDGKLADIAPTLLNILGEMPPIEMTGENLLRR